MAFCKHALTASAIEADFIHGITVSQELQDEAQQLLTAKSIPWVRLKDISSELKSTDANEHWLHQICEGTQLVLNAPRKREESRELQERLAKLQEQVDQAAYNRMVSDVTKKV